MKHWYFVFLLLALSMYATSVNAFYFWIDGFKYRAVDKNESIAELVSVPLLCKGTCITPSSIEYQGKEYSVVSIASSAFGGCSLLSEVSLGDDVRVIGHSAFRGCRLLKSVVVPPLVAKVEGFVFEKGVFADVTLVVPRGCKEAYAQACVWSSFATIVEE